MINIDFSGYLVIVLTLIFNAFCTGIGVTLGMHFANKKVLNKEKENIDDIVKKVIEELDKRKEEEYIPKVIDE